MGRGNYKWFLALCLSTGVLVGYGAFLSWKVLHPMVNAHLDRHAAWHELQRPSLHKSDYFSRVFMSRAERALDIIGTTFDLGGLSISGVGLLCLLTFPLPLALLAYHLYLIWAGMTTNESSKWADWKEDMATGSVFVGELNRKNHRLVTDYQNDTRDNRAPYDMDSDIDWPHTSHQCLVMTQDGMPPSRIPPDVATAVVEDSWRPIYKLKDVVNIYDLGFWDNMIEVIKN